MYSADGRFRQIYADVGLSQIALTDNPTTGVSFQQEVSTSLQVVPENADIVSVRSQNGERPKRPTARNSTSIYILCVHN
jgi:hypothetical protein